MSKQNVPQEVRRARELAAQFEDLKKSLREQDDTFAALVAEHGSGGDPETLPAEIAGLFESASALPSSQSLAPNARPHGPVVRG